MNRGDQPPSDLFGTGRSRPIELHRTGDAVALLDAASDLRCAAGPEQSVARLTGFDRPGVLVRLTPRQTTLTCSITPLDDVARDVRRGPGELSSDDVRGWVVALAMHRARDFQHVDMAAGVVRAALSIYEHVRLDEPPRNLGIFEAPRSVIQARELTVLALRAAGCPIGPQVRKRPAVEHPDLYLD